MATDPYAEFSPAPAADPYAEFKPASQAAASPTDHGSDAAQFDETTPADAIAPGSSRDLSNAAAGAGKAFVDTGRGVYQLGASIGHAMGLVSDEKLAKIQADVDEAKHLDAPLMATTAGKVGNAVGVGAQLAAIPATGIVGGAALGAGFGAIQPVATGETRTANTGTGALGGGLGGAGGKIISGVLGGFGGSMGKQAAVDTLKAEGIPMSVAERTGSKAAQAVERTSAMTSDAAADFAQEQGHAFNRAVLKRIGVDDPTVTAATPDVLGPAKAKITGVMNDFAKKTNINVDDALLTDMGNVEHAAMRQLPASDVGPIKANINDILENATRNGGKLDGTFYQKLNSNLGALSKNPSTAPIAHDLQDAVNDALQRSADPKDVAALTTARQQYRALKQIEPAVDPATGNISVPKLMNSLGVKANRSQSLYGNGDQSLMDLARAAKQVIPDRLGNSGTPERALGAMGAMETLGSGEPVKAATKLAAGTLGLNVAGRAMRSQGAVGNLLANGIPGVSAAAPVIRRVGPLAGTLGAQFGTHGEENSQ